MVSSCPRAQTEIKTASQRLGCKNDTYGNSQYMCLPNEEKSSLVEFCFEGEMGIELKGSCLEVYGGKQINRYSCSRFSQGCPDTDFYKYNIHKYPSCLEINTERRCYVAEPHCSDQISEGGIWPGIGIGVAILIIALTIIAVVKCIIRRRKSNRKKAQTNEANPDETALLKKDQPKHPAPSTENGHGDLETAPRLENVGGINFSHKNIGFLDIKGNKLHVTSIAANMDKFDVKFQGHASSTRAEHAIPTTADDEEHACSTRAEHAIPTTADDEERTTAERTEWTNDGEKEQTIPFILKSEDSTPLMKSRNKEQTIPFILKSEDSTPLMKSRNKEQGIAELTENKNTMKLVMDGMEYTYKLLFAVDEEGKEENDIPIRTSKREMQSPNTTTSWIEDKIPN